MEITVIAYVNTQSSVQFGGDDAFISFGDGTSKSVPETERETVDSGLFLGRSRYTTTHTYSAYGSYVISYSEPNRNAGTLNFDASGSTRMYTETLISVQANTCDSTPALLVPPFDRACSGTTFFHNPGAFDSDGDSLSYELVAPKKDATSAVTNYLFPDNQKFYSDAGIIYGQGNEEKTGPPSFTIDAIDGTVVWDAPGAVGEYGVAIKVKEWKFQPANGKWYEAGYVIRDMQIIVEDCDNRKPKLTPPPDICVVAGTPVLFDIPASDPDGDNVVIEGFSEVFSLMENPAVLEPESGTLQSTGAPNDTASIQFKWATSCTHVRPQPYKVVFKISDRPQSGPRLVQFYTINIRVLAPPPEYQSVSINPVMKTAILKWTYSCGNVMAFQIWRRISEFQYDQAECAFGMPAFLHYEMVAEVPGTSADYTDHDLAYGAQYCYRIIALVGDQKIPSRISIDTCFIPKPAEAPVVTNVSVENTDEENGEIQVRWTRPFDIDIQQYPPPYRYELLRKNESDPESAFQVVTTEKIADTVYMDTGLNTKANSYRYQVVLYVPSLTSAPLDSSTEASSVFAVAKPILNGIDVTWTANTPWYNYSSIYPFHLVYRANSPAGPFVLIASVNVNESDFHYADYGAYNDDPLANTLYYYKVKTRGTYGNPDIMSPLQNFSEVTVGQVLDTIPPCAPVVSIVKTNCSDFACDGTDYYTKLTWLGSQKDCRNDDAVDYEVLVRSGDNNGFTSLGIMADDHFVHSHLSSLNNCYTVIGIDRAGNRSDSSNLVCSSNCLNFKLPNVITPDVSDQKNDFLTTYPEDGSNPDDCPRSIRQVDFTIYSRWGQEIYTTTVTGGESPVFWDGLTGTGKEADGGVYFYEALVTFDTNDPQLRIQRFKGWVHLIR